MKCFHSAKVTTGTAHFGKPKTYQKLKVGGFEQLEDDPIDDFEIESNQETEGQLQTSEGELPTDDSDDIAENWWNQTEE
jgi:hypothetical protein